MLTWTAYLFAGLAVGRLPLRRISVGLKLLVSGLVLAVAAKVASAVLLAAVGGESSLTASQGRLTGPIDRLLAGGLFGTTPPGTGAG